MSPSRRTAVLAVAAVLAATAPPAARSQAQEHDDAPRAALTADELCAVRAALAGGDARRVRVA